MSKEVLERLQSGRIFAIIRGVSSDNIISLVDALQKGGVCCAEVTIDQSSGEGMKDSLLSIKKLDEYFGDSVCVGAGTVLSCEQLHLASAAGAKYIVSPNTDESVIREAKKMNLVSVPGAMTPSEIANAYKYGADMVKVFPADFLGAAYFKSVKAPLSHIPLVAVGNVNLDNLKSYFDAGACAAGVGGSLVSKKLIAQGDLEGITSIAKQFSELVKSL